MAELIVSINFQIDTYAEKLPSIFGNVFLQPTIVGGALDRHFTYIVDLSNVGKISNHVMASLCNGQ